MSSLAQAVIAALGSGGACGDLLLEAGESDPAGAEAALRAAVGSPLLAPEMTSWVPDVLTSARPGFAAQQLLELAGRFERSTRREFDLARYPLLPHVLGNSSFLARVLLRHPRWVEELAGDLPDAPGPEPIEPDYTAIRIEKYKGLLRIAARDFAGRDFEDSLTELAELARRCLSAALASTSRSLGMPAPHMRALGRLGRGEPSFAAEAELALEAPASLSAADLQTFAEHFKKHLEVPGEDGFAYRVDLSLRLPGEEPPTERIHSPTQREAYLWLRRSEHGQEYEDERAAGDFPEEPAAQTRLARRMGYRHERGDAARENLLEDRERALAGTA